jgi:peptidoglycan/LPS O-acetylase OafA/YrhL
MVFLFHVYGISYGGAPKETSLIMSFIVGGNSGVTLFFVLSGFLLSLPWLNYFLGKKPVAPSISYFYKSRALRILPLYYSTIVFSVLVSQNIVSGLKAASFFYVGFDIFPFSVVWWTLSTEIQFYLLLPVCFWAWHHARYTRALLLFSLLLWLGAYLTLVIFKCFPGDFSSVFYTKSLFGRLPAFLVGILSALIYTRYASTLKSLSNRGVMTYISTAAFIVIFYLLGLVIQASINMGDGEAEGSWHVRHTYEAILWSAAMLVLVLGRPIGRQLLVNKVMALCGKLSYSLYLLHVPVLFYIIYPIKKSMNSDVYLNSLYLYIVPALGLLLCFILAMFSYKFIELPFLNLKRKLPV